MNEELDNLLNNYIKPEHSLSLGKQLSLAHFKNQANQMSREQAIELAVKSFHTMLVREELTTELVKQSWGLDNAA